MGSDGICMGSCVPFSLFIGSECIQHRGLVFFFERRMGLFYRVGLAGGNGLVCLMSMVLDWTGLDTGNYLLVGGVRFMRGP